MRMLGKPDLRAAACFETPACASLRQAPQHEAG
jgi:hypothetical protein